MHLSFKDKSLSSTLPLNKVQCKCDFHLTKSDNCSPSLLPLAPLAVLLCQVIVVQLHSNSDNSLSPGAVAGIFDVCLVSCPVIRGFSGLVEGANSRFLQT